MSVSIADFRYSLPQELIALYPTEERTASRLLCLDGRSGTICHRGFSDLEGLLRRGDLLIFNDTKVIPARLYGYKRDTGGRIEILVERLVSSRQMLVQLRSSKSPRPGTVLRVDDAQGETDAELLVEDKQEGFFRLRSVQQDLAPLLERYGHMPLPPYIARDDEDLDRSRYQTVYASRPGAVAAPTAGLHFDEDLLGYLKQIGVDQATVTLHVGAGTFQPLRCDDIADHQMHAEYVEVSEQVSDSVMRAHNDGGRVVAVGTTSVRCLETAAASGTLSPYYGDTRLFIYPPYRFRCVDAMITNFHLPESTLLMLVSAFAGRELVLSAYHEAIRQRYRFFSYGDAMFVEADRAPSLKVESKPS